jgi:hypothetical protein
MSKKAFSDKYWISKPQNILLQLLCLETIEVDANASAQQIVFEIHILSSTPFFYKTKNNFLMSFNFYASAKCSAFYSM